MECIIDASRLYLHVFFNKGNELLFEASNHPTVEMEPKSNTAQGFFRMSVGYLGVATLSCMEC